jgi:amidase
MGDPLADLDATAQAALVRTGEASAAELVNAAIARVERVDPELGAVVLPRFDHARAEAGADIPDGPFRGVPFLTKDLRCPTEGEAQTDGMRFAKDAGFRATYTSELASRFRAAGLVNLGRTNSPELGLVPTTEPEAWGPTRNPWDPARSPGGSSGGSAAAVAAGLVPCAHASDGGGSIRIPGSACGLPGLKTSRGLIPVGPRVSELTSFLSVQFVLTRSVRDAAALLDAVAGSVPGDPLVAPRTRSSFVDAARTAPPELRIGMMGAAPGGGPVHAECTAATDAAARLLESLGHAVESAHPAAIDDPERGVLFGEIWGVIAAASLRAWGDAVGRPVAEDDVEPGTWALASRGRDTTAVDYLTAVGRVSDWSRAMADWWEPHNGSRGFDLLLTPTMAEPPVPLGTFATTPDNPWTGLLRSGPYTPFTPAFNMTGQPAISLPLHESADGLPIGVQLVAAYGRDDLLLSVATQLEAAAPWADRRPRVHAATS